MTRKYVMLVNTICGMGGGQMYTNNKLAYMIAQDWKTYVFFGVDGPIIIPELQQYKQGFIPEIASSPLVYKAKTVERVLNKLEKAIGPCDELVIESCSGHMALWGELLAARLRGKNMVHLLDERNDLIVPVEYLDFFRFKLERRELSGINRESLKMLFRYSPEIDGNNAYFLPSACQNVTCDCPLPFEIPADRKVLGCIGRLEKPYVYAAAQAFKTVAQNHKSESFAVVFIGGSPEPQYETSIRTLFKDVENVTMLITGFLFPIPQKLINSVDVFISSAGSAGVSYRGGRMTISIDSRDNQAIGVLGYTTRNSLNRADEPCMDPAELLEKVLFSDYLNGFAYQQAPADDVDGKLAKHLEFLANSQQKKAYYDILCLKASGKDKTKKMIVDLVGPRIYTHLRPLLANLQKFAS